MATPSALLEAPEPAGPGPIPQRVAAAEEALRQSELFTRSILSSLTAHIAVLDPSGVIVLVNDAWTQHAHEGRGFMARPPVGAHYLDCCRAAARPGEPNPLAEGLQRVLEGRHDAFTWEYPASDHPRPGWYLVTVTQLSDRSGRVVVSHVNITARKAAEEKVRQLFHILDHARESICVRELDGRVRYVNQGCERLMGWTLREASGKSVVDFCYRNPAEFHEATRILLTQGAWQGELQLRTRDGRDIVVDSHWTLVRESEDQTAVLVISSDITEKKRLEVQLLRAQRMETIGTLASGIAHDLNNVLAPILLGVPALRRDSTPGERREWAALIESSCRRATGVIRQLLAIGRGGPLQTAAIPTDHLIRDVLRIARETFPRSIRIEDLTSTTLWPVLGDSVQLHLVLLNLAVNARDAMPRGGTLRLQADNVVLDEHFASQQQGARPGPHVRIRVEDTGEGIPPESLGRIFEPLFTTKPPGQGTGLGLPTALHIVREHRGSIRVESVQGEGTVFTLHLPADPGAEPGAEQAEIPRFPPRARGELVLVVDDEPAVRQATARTLSDHGYETLLTGDGADALALFAQHHARIQAVVCDLSMPILDGQVFVRAARRIRPGIPVIISTGIGRTDLSTHESDIGDIVVLPKPHSAWDLLNQLHLLLHPGERHDCDPA